MHLRARMSGPLAALLLSSVTVGSEAAVTSLSAQTLARIDAVAQETLEKHASAGLAVGIMSEGRMIFSKGYGRADLEHGVATRPETVFRIGSLTKQFTAAGILRLAEQGKLGLDDKLARFFPDFPRSNEVSLRQLLTHTSGIHDYTAGPDYALISLRDYTTEEFVRVIAGQAALYDFAPGTAWSYSNSGYFLLGAIMEKISGVSFKKFLDTQVISRAGIKNTAVDDNADIVPHRARGYERSSPDSREFHNASYTSMTVPGGAGNLRSNVADLAQWSHALFNGKVVSTASFREMIAPGRLANGNLASTAIFMPPPPPGASAPPAAPPRPGDFGFGLLLDTKDGYERVWHGGGINGFNSMLETFPSLSLTIVVLANADGGAAEAANSIVEAVLQQSRAADTSRPKAARPN